MIEVVTKEIEQYFYYIKDVYLKTFDKLLSFDVKEQIKQYSYQDIKYELDADFNIRITDTINYKLNITSFIENNHLDTKEIDCLKEKQKKYVEYLIQNKEDITKILKSHMLENMMLLFIPKKDVLGYGLSTYLANQFSKQFHLTTLNIYDKEANVIESLINLLGQKTVLKCLLNGDIENLGEIYDKYSLDIENNFENVYSALEQEFNHYNKNKGKIYFIDLLYNYGNLNYDSVIKKINSLDKEIDKSKQEFNLRIESILSCTKELERYIILLSEEDKNKLYYSTLNLKRILEKKDASEIYKNEILQIEDELKPIVDGIWNYYINFEGEYDSSSSYWFLIQNYNQRSDDKYQIMNLITNDHTRIPINKNRYKYGFIYKIKSGAIIYSVPDKMIWDLDDDKIEIEEQIYSKLLTPRNLLSLTLSNEKEYNNVLVDANLIEKTAVYCICKSTNDPDYMKALEISNKYELPLIPLHEYDILEK